MYKQSSTSIISRNFLNVVQQDIQVLRVHMCTLARVPRTNVHMVRIIFTTVIFDFPAYMVITPRISSCCSSENIIIHSLTLYKTNTSYQGFSSFWPLEREKNLEERCCSCQTLKASARA